MPTLAHTYIRTPQGRFTAFNPGAVMLPPLKSLLKAVDGKLTTSELELTLSHLGNVEALLVDLESAGLIADKSIVFSQIGLPLGQEQALMDSDNPLMQTNFGDLGADRVNPWQNTSSSGLDALPVSASAKPDTLLDRMAQQLADTMATFVLTHLPDKAFKELITIENIHTPQQLEAALPAYEILVQPLGEVGIKHVAQLRQLMHKIFAQ